MTREGRSVFLAILTLLIYAGILFLEYGEILFPFPLNEVIFLFVSIQFSIWNWKKYKFILTCILLAGFFNLLSTQFFWSFFLNSMDMEGFVNTITPDLLKISYYIFISLAFAIGIIQSSLKHKILYYLPHQIALIIALIFSSQVAETTIFASIAIISGSLKHNSPIQLLWILLAILQLMKLLTLNF